MYIVAYKGWNNKIPRWINQLITQHDMMYHYAEKYPDIMFVEVENTGFDDIKVAMSPNKEQLDALIDDIAQSGTLAAIPYSHDLPFTGGHRPKYIPDPDAPD